MNFEELYDIKDIQIIQDSITSATGVASIVTNLNGNSITKPSNLCKICKDIVNKNYNGIHPKSLMATLHRQTPLSPQPYMS
jgi:ligand-binding sensor protein